MAKKTIIINGRFFKGQKYTGTYNSSLEIVRNLSLSDCFEFVLVVPQKSQSEVAKELPNCRVLGSRLLDLLNHQIWEQLVFPFIYKDNLHLNLMGTAPILNSQNQIMVVHDLNYLKCKESFSLLYRIMGKIIKYFPGKLSGRIICFSDYVKNDLEKIWEIEASKISVIPQGIRACARLEKPVQQGEYFLCVGGMQPHKNLSRILSAWFLFSEEHSNYRLIIVGKKQKYFNSLLCPPELLSKAIEFTGHVSNERLDELYNNAAALVYPSLEEGFGLPILECQFQGTPVITSNCSSMPEIAGDGALLVDPLNPIAILDAMNSIVTDDELVASLVGKGFENFSKYHWENFVSKFEKLYET